MDGHFAASRAHRDTNITGSERGGIIHTVTDHRHLVALGFHGPDKFNLVLRQAIALGFFAADLGRHARSHDLTITADHGHTPDAGFLQLHQGFFRFSAGLVLHADPADTLAIAGDKNQA